MSRRLAALQVTHRNTASSSLTFSGAPFEVIVPCLDEAANIFVDVSCVDDHDVWRLLKSRYAGRVLWGTDFPALSAKSGESLTSTMRKSVRCCRLYSDNADFQHAFTEFLHGKKDG